MRICSIHCVESKDRKTKANHSRSMIRAKLYLCTYRSINHRIRQAYITHSLLPYGVSSEASAPAPAPADMAPFIRSVNRATNNSCSWEESSDTLFPPPQDDPTHYPTSYRIVSVIVARGSIAKWKDPFLHGQVCGDLEGLTFDKSYDAIRFLRRR